MTDDLVGRAWLDALPEQILLLEAVRADGRIVDFTRRDFNRAAQEEIGIPRAELLGSSVTSVGPKFYGPATLETLIECLETGRPLLLNDIRYEMNGRPKYANIRVARAGAELLAVSWRDVGDRIEADARFRRLLETSNVGMALATPDGKFEMINQAFCDQLGYDQKTLTTKSWQDLTPASYLAADLKNIADLLAGRLDTYRLLKQHIHADGHLVWADLSVSCLRDANGAVQYLFGQIVDITEQMEARARQAKADARFRRLMETSNVAMSLAKVDGRLDVVNAAMCELLGYDEATLRTMTWQELTPAHYLEADLKNTEELLAGRLDTYRVTKQMIHADGRLIWTDLSVSCLRDDAGAVEYFVAQCVDVTAEVEAREQLATQERQNRVLAERLADELSSAALYVTSILPGELEGPVHVSSQYLPSQRVGGDSFDYRWIDEDHLMVYLIDVSGHGVDAALLSVSVHNLLRSGTVPVASLLEPEKVLAELNRLFQMKSQANRFFTIWYGVYEKSTGLLRYASAGHPPALAIDVGGNTATATTLSTKCLPIGVMADAEFVSETYHIPQSSQLLIFSDGAYELIDADGQWWSLEDFIDVCTECVAQESCSLDALVTRLQHHAADGNFLDDCALIQLTFD
jgi:PAS domain S-box-containing protein